MKVLAGMTADKMPQVMAVFAATLSAISDGMQYGWTSPMIPVLQSANSPIKISESDVVWMESISMIGAIIRLPITIICEKKFGRKRTIIFASCNTLIAWILIALAKSVPMLLAARLLTGVAGDVAFVSSPLYVAEIAEQSIRGFLGSCVFIMMLLGIVIVYSVAPFFSIATSSIIGITVILLQLTIFPFMPESPYYLMKKNRKREARVALQTLRNYQDVDVEFEEIRQAVERQKQEKGKFTDIFKLKNTRQGLIILSMLNFAQHFSGISIMLMNIHSILHDAESVVSASAGGIIFSVLMLISVIIGSMMVDMVGRRFLLLTSSITTGVSVATLAIYFTFQKLEVDIEHYNWVPLVAVMTYALSFKLGLGLIPIVLAAEIFPTGVKEMGMTLADVTYILFGAMSIHMYQFMENNIGIYAPFYVFTLTCVLITLFTVFYIPETKGKSLEEIQYLLKGETYDGPTLNEIKVDPSVIEFDVTQDMPKLREFIRRSSVVGLTEDLGKKDGKKVGKRKLMVEKVEEDDEDNERQDPDGEGQDPDEEKRNPKDGEKVKNAKHKRKTSYEGKMGRINEAFSETEEMETATDDHESLRSKDGSISSSDGSGVEEDDDEPKYESQMAMDIAKLLKKLNIPEIAVEDRHSESEASEKDVKDESNPAEPEVDHSPNQLNVAPRNKVEAQRKSVPSSDKIADYLDSLAVGKHKSSF